MTNSFAALLELLDPHRFARGIEPSREATREVTVRRLKQDLVNDDGTPRFPRRKVVMLEVEHPESEREVHAQLVAYGAARAAPARAASASARAAADFVTTLLKKRLFSSPAAFLRTLEVHRETLLRERRPEAPPTPTVLQRLFEDAASTRSTARRARTASARPSARRSTRPRRRSRAARPGRSWRCWSSMIAWAEPMARSRGRTHAAAARLGAGQRQAKRRVHAIERVIVFSEYRATQRYLQERLVARGIAGDRVELLDGTTSAEERERIKSQWQEPPAEYPGPGAAGDRRGVGGDLAAAPVPSARARRDPVEPEPARSSATAGSTATASRRAEVLVHHCVSAGWETAAARVARGRSRLPRARGDEGRADPRGPRERRSGDRRARSRRRCSAGARRSTTPASSASAASRALLEQERRMRERLAALRDELAESRTTLHLQPDRVERVVATALALARQPSLQPGAEPGT